ncbi:MAG: penicillin-binding protein 2, partial [Patescibacteria group bacterium]
PVRTAQVLDELLPVVLEEAVALLAEPVETSDADAERTRYERILAQLSKDDDPYEPIERKVSDEAARDIERAHLYGIHILKERFRFYPEGEAFAHVTGFVSPSDDGVPSGKYGVEGFFDTVLAGSGGYRFQERDAHGRWIGVGARRIEPAQNGPDVILTMDRAVQFVACGLLKEAVELYEADRGSLVILNPKNGNVIAMCGAPTYDPNVYNEVESIEVYNNQTTFVAYEPGSVFKPLVMAAAIDLNVVSPTDFFEDTGEVNIDRFTIHNSDLKAHGWVSMTEILQQSLNTGMIHVMRQMGGPQMARFIRAFGFGERLGIELDTEVAGTIDALDKDSEIFYATASYGQGVTVTPLQLAAAYGALANNGLYITPRIVSEIRYRDGIVERPAIESRQVVSPKTAQTISAMLVSVVEDGHAKTASVEGYYIAAKTGTAQVAREDGAGYKTDETIATVVGYGPVSDPQFVLLVRLDHPRTSPWATSTSAYVFGDIATFLLEYLHIPPDR